MTRSLELLQNATGVRAFYDDERERAMKEAPETLAPEDLVIRGQFYQTALRGLAEVLHDKRKGALDEADPNEVLREKLRPEMRQLAMLNNLEAYASAYSEGEVGQDLLPHQHRPFQRMLDFLKEDAFSTPGYLNVPTAFGKSFLSFKMIEALGIGTEASEYDAEPLRALYLVPRELLLHQVIGADGERGFGRFAPGLHVTPYYGKEKDLSGDVVVMLYPSYVKATKKGLIPDGLFDLKVYDEGHHALGPEVRKVIKERREREPALEFAMTASAQYNKYKGVSHLFPIEIDNIRLVEAIKDGSLASVQCWLYETNSLIRLEEGRKGDYSEEELKPLRFDETRNQKAIEFIAGFAQKGLRGLVRCVQGERCAHANELAELARKRVIKDPKTGEERHLRVEAMSTFQSDEEQIAIEQKFANGELDAITYVSMLDEGWDNKWAKFLIRLAPTCSEVVATQSTGRILRPNAQQPLAQLVDFIDVIDGKRMPVTFIKTLQTRTERQGEIVGLEEEDDEGTGESKERAKKIRENAMSAEDFEVSLAERLSRTDYKLVDELLIESQDPPEGWLTTDILLQASGFTYFGLYRYLEKEHGLSPLRSNTGRLYYPPHTLDLIREDVVGRIAAPEYHPLVELEDKLGLTRERLRGMIAELAINTMLLRSADTLREQYHIHQDDADRLKEYVGGADGYVSFDDFAVELGITTQTLTKRIPEAIKPEWRRSVVTGIKQRYITTTQAEQIKQALLPKPGHMTMHDMAEEWGVSLSNINSIITEEDKAKAAPAIHRRTKRYHLHYPPEVLEVLRTRCNAPKSVLSIPMMADFFGVEPAQIDRVLSDGIRGEAQAWKTRRGSDETAKFYPSSHLHEIARLLGVSFSERLDYCMPVSKAAARLGVDEGAILAYFAGESHVREIKTGGEALLFVLPGPWREMKRVPPAPSSWLTLQEVIGRLPAHVQADAAKIENLKAYLERLSSGHWRIMKPLGSKAAPRRHFAPEVVVHAFTRFK